MQEPYRNASGSSKLTLLVTSVAALALFCFAAPSAKAQTYLVKIQAGTAGIDCNDAGGTGILIISGDTLEFFGGTGNGCYFGQVGYGAGASTCTSAGPSPTTCSDLAGIDSVAGASQYGLVTGPHQTIMPEDAPHPRSAQLRLPTRIFS